MRAKKAMLPLYSRKALPLKKKAMYSAFKPRGNCLSGMRYQC
jgi:hypothetical protein